jgi:uncharacterized phage protein (TIGR02216 family)
MSAAPPPGESLAAALYRLAVAGLGLTPAAAWAATPRELLLAAAALRGDDEAGRQRLSRAAFAALLARYPDRSFATCTIVQHDAVCDGEDTG